MISMPPRMRYLSWRLSERYFAQLRRPEDLRVSADDVYLAPHCDDIAYSIGHFAKARGRGRLVTVFTRSSFTLRPDLAGLQEEQVTAMRGAEDRRFAAACGLAYSDLELPEAPLRGFEPTNRAGARQEAAHLGSSIMPRLLALAEERPLHQRPWLFAPMGVGGHLDHAIVLLLLAANQAALTRRFRLAFYEDLPYAVWYDERVRGRARFRALIGKRGWRRIVFRLGNGVPDKLALMGLYESQHAAPPAISGFTPELRPAALPHEAIWVSGRL